MEVVLNYLSKVDSREYLIAFLLIFVCAAPFAELFTDLWSSIFKKRV